jgi:hypothetical protein
VAILLRLIQEPLDSETESQSGLRFSLNTGAEGNTSAAGRQGWTGDEVMSIGDQGPRELTYLFPGRERRLTDVGGDGEFADRLLG